MSHRTDLVPYPSRRKIAITPTNVICSQDNFHLRKKLTDSETGLCAKRKKFQLYE